MLGVPPVLMLLSKVQQLLYGKGAAGDTALTNCSLARQLYRVSAQRDPGITRRIKKNIHEGRLRTVSGMIG